MNKTYNIMCTVMHTDSEDSVLTSLGLLPVDHTKAEAAVLQAKLGLKIHDINERDSKKLTSTMLDALESGEVTFAELVFMATEGWRNLGSAGALSKFLIHEHGKGNFYKMVADMAMKED